MLHLELNCFTESIRKQNGLVGSVFSFFAEVLNCALGFMRAPGLW